VTKYACLVFLSGVGEFGGTISHIRLVVCELRTVALGEEKFLKVLSINWSGKHPGLRQNK
jgi:hypothetical protein